VDTVKSRITTRTEQFLTYASNEMHFFDKNNTQVYYLVMANAPIHRLAKVCDLIESRHCKCLYLRAYPPILNLIEDFRSTGKAWVRQNALTADDRLSDSIFELVQKQTRIDFEAWIRHAASFLPAIRALGEN
jgi:transposase